MKTHDKKTLANEYCLCRDIPHRWVGENLGQLVIGTGVSKDVIYSIYNIPYSEIVSTIDSMCDYDEFGYFTCVKSRYAL